MEQFSNFSSMKTSEIRIGREERIPSSNNLFHLTAAEKALLEISDDEVERLLEGAQAGVPEALEKLLGWAYLTAYQYFHWSVSRERALSVEDAEDLTTAFFLEFERTLPRLKSATRFTRHVLKQNLRRNSRRQKMRRLREIVMSGKEFENKAGGLAPEPAWQKWTDEQFRQYQTVLRALESADEVTQRIIRFRLQEPPLEHKEIAGHLEMSETAIRMRVTRFYALVRKKYEKIRYFI